MAQFEGDEINFGDTVVIETDVDDNTSAVLQMLNLVPIMGEEAEYGAASEWLLLSAEGEEDQTCQVIQYGENVRSPTAVPPTASDACESHHARGNPHCTADLGGAEIIHAHGCAP